MEMNQGLPLWRWTKASPCGEDRCVDTKASACSCDYLPIFHPRVILLGWLDWPIGQTILRVRCAWERRIGGCPRGFVTNWILLSCYLLVIFDLRVFPSLCSCVHHSFFVFIVPSAQIRENRDQPTSYGIRALGWHGFELCFHQNPPNFSSFLRNSKISTKNSLALIRADLSIRCVFGSFCPWICCFRTPSIFVCVP